MRRVFYLDMWPFTNQILFCRVPVRSLPTHAGISTPQFRPHTQVHVPSDQNNDLVTMEGQPWKDWRAVFSPGFSANNLIKVVPRLLEAVSTYSDILAKHAQAKDLFYLERVTIGMTMDIIGVVTLYENQRLFGHFVADDN